MMKEGNAVWQPREMQWHQVYVVLAQALQSFDESLHGALQVGVELYGS